MKTLKKIASLVIITCLLGGLLVTAASCGLTTRTAGTVDGEDIPAGMYIYFLHSAIYNLEQQYQYGQLSSEYTDASSEEESAEAPAESSSVESVESSVDEAAASTESSAEESSSEESSDTNPDTLWDAVIDNKTAKDYVIDEAYRNCAWVIVMEKKAAEYEIVLDDNDKAQLEQTYENNGGKLQLEEDLNKMGVSFATYERIVKASLIQSHIKEKLFGLEGETPVSKDEMNKEYAENYRRVKHILFKTNDLADDTDEAGNVTKTVDQKKAEIENTYKDVLARAQKGEDFESLVEEYSDDSMDADKGYVFKKGQMVSEFETAAWDLPVGEIATCESDYGWHIIKAYDPYEKDEYMTEALSDFVSSYENENYTKLEDEWVAAAQVNRSSAATRRYKPSKIYEDNNVASNVSAQIEYYNSYYSAMMASGNN